MKCRKNRMARKGHKRLFGGRWEDNLEMDEVLYANYGKMTAEHLATRINTKFDTTFTAKAIHNRAFDLGVKAADNQDLLTIAQAAKELGINPSAISKFITKHQLSTSGRGKYTYLSDDTWRVVQAEWPIITEPCISAREASRRLNYEETTLHKHHLKTGTIRAYRHGRRWKVPVAEVERMEREQRGEKYL